MIEQYRTTIQNLLEEHPEYGEVMFGNLKAKDIYRQMQFVSNGTTYTVENVYVVMKSDGFGNNTPSVRINVGYVYYLGLGSAPSWFTSGGNMEWTQNVGMGMEVETPDGKHGIIHHVHGYKTPKGGRYVSVRMGEKYRNFTQEELIINNAHNE